LSPKADWNNWRETVLAKVDPRRTALAIIDLQNDFCADWGALALLGSDVSPCREAANRITKFLSLVREKIPLVALFRLEYEVGKLSTAQQERLLRDGRPVICAPGTPGCELFIRPEPGDRVFTKHRYSAFTNEAFRQVLSDLSIETVVVAGVDTHICVEGTVRHGYDLGYRMLVLGDLVATRKSEIVRHEHTLTLCERYFGVVIESVRFLEMLTAPARIASSLGST